RLDLHRELGEIDADLVIVGADVRDAQVLAVGQEVRVPGQNRDLGFLGCLQCNGHGCRIRRRHRNAVDLLGDQVLHDRDLLVATAVFTRADVHALESAVGFFLGLLAAIARLIEKWIVHVLRHERENFLALRVGGAGEGERVDGECCRQDGFQHLCLLSSTPLIDGSGTAFVRYLQVFSLSHAAAKMDLPPDCIPRSTASTIMAPTNAPCQFESIPAISAALGMPPANAARMTAPSAVPGPPIGPAPPITAAAMTRNSYPVPNALMADPL